ncbi:MAG: beta-lactamase family protein, partial [Candidatus Saccharicenans sp.]|nr:beta-lactamase family protein [Candidatus Saccharicenans sp.]
MNFRLSSILQREKTSLARSVGRKRKIPSQAPGIRLRVAASCLGLAWLVLAFCLPAWPGNLPVVRPGEVGLSAGRLERLGQVMQSYCDQKGAPGMVVLIARDGKVAYQRSFGKFRLDKPDPMPLNAIFRIASQSKAVTSVAVMMLMEEGKLLLDDPISKYLPEFKETDVAVKPEGKEAKGYSVVPAKRQITIRDLLTHTAGISYGDGP